MDRKDYYFRQLLTEAELDEGFEHSEVAQRAVMADQNLDGVFQGGQVGEQLTPSLSVDVAGPGLCYDKLGRRLQWTPAQVVDCSVDEFAASTSVAAPGNAKIVSVFVEFDRLLSDERTDGNSAQVFFERTESIKFNVVQGAEAVSGLEVATALRSDQLLLADITLIFGQASILNADIDSLTRRQDAFVLTGAPNNEREGTVRTILQAFQDQINDMVNSGGGLIGYAGGGAWADGTTNPATNVEAQLDKIIADLAVGSGAAKIAIAAGSPWFDATTNPAERLDQRVDSIISDLAGTAGGAKIGLPVSPAWADAATRASEGAQGRVDGIISDLGGANGASKVGVDATGGIIAGSVKSQLAALETDVALNTTDRHNHGGTFNQQVSLSAMTNSSFASVAGGAGNTWALDTPSLKPETFCWNQLDQANAGSALVIPIVPPDDKHLTVATVAVYGDRSGAATVAGQLVVVNHITETRTIKASSTGDVLSQAGVGASFALDPTDFAPNQVTENCQLEIWSESAGAGDRNFIFSVLVTWT